MIRAKLCIGFVLLGLVASLTGGCTSESVPPVESAAEARDAAIAYLLEHQPQDAPGAALEWQEQDVTPPELVGAVTTEFVSDEWTIEVTYPVVLPENTVYRVVVSSITLGWHWEGSVKYDGTVAETSAFKQMSKEGSQAIAEESVRNSPTFTFDGMEDSLRLTGTLTARCPYCWVFIFEFDSRHAGYGDRTGQAVAEVITAHRAVIAVQQLEITSAIMDDRWDMLGQTMITQSELVSL